MKRTFTKYLVMLGAILVVSGILYIRKPDSFSKPQFWAEDGTVFFAQAYHHGLDSHFEPYAGYYHEVPRLVASAALVGPYRWAPRIYNFSALAVMLGLVAIMFSSRLDLRFPFVFALAVALVPFFRGEVYLNLTNVQWPLALLLLLTALQRPPKTAADGLLDGSIIVLAGLTGPFAVLVLPFFVLRWLRDRTWGAFVTTGLAIAVTAIQIQSILQHPVYLAPHDEHTARSWIDLLGWKLSGNLFLGHEAPYAMNPMWLVVGGGAVLVYLLWRLSRLAEGRRLGLPMLYFGAAVLCLACFKFRHAANLLVPPAAATRYFFVPFVVVAWCLLILVIHDKRWFKVPAFLLLALILRSSLISDFTSPPLRNFRWPKHAARIGVEEAPKIPINPPGWSIQLEPGFRDGI